MPDAAVTDALSLQREDISTMHDASNNILPRLVYFGLTFFVERDTNNTYHQDVQYRESEGDALASPILVAALWLVAHLFFLSAFLTALTDALVAGLPSSTTFLQPLSAPPATAPESAMMAASLSSLLLRRNSLS